MEKHTQLSECTTKRGNSLFGKLELGEKNGVNARAGLVAGVLVVTEGLDHVIERAGHVRVLST